MKHFDFEFTSEKSATTVRRELLQASTGQLAGWGYDLTSQSDVGMTYSRKYRKWWIIALAVCLFPIGLLFLLAAETATITATIEPGDDTDEGSVLIINGTAPKKVVQAFATMEL